MVVESPEPMERETPAFSGAGFDDRDGCLNHRLGSPLSGCQDGRPMVKDRAMDAHQLSGTIRSYIGCEVLCEGQEKHSHTPENGQYNFPQLHQQAGWHSLTGTEPSNKRPMDMVLGEGNHLTCHTPSGSIERHCRRRVSCDEGQDRLDAMPPNLQEDQSPPRATTGGPICIQTNPPTPSICQLETRSTCYDNGCLHPQLG